MEKRLQDTIATYRKKKKLTQEGLGALLGISAPAVSKWESGASCPDITLLAPLARALGISVDQLLDFHSELSDQQIKMMETNMSNCFEKEGFEQGRQACYQLLKQYPQSAMLRIRLATLFQRYLILIDQVDEEKSQEVMLEVLEIVKPALQDSNLDMVMSARVMLVNYYMIVHDFTKAEQTLEQLPKRQYIQEDFLATLAIMKEDYDQAQEVVENNFCWHFQSTLTSLLELAGIENRRGHTEQAIQLVEIQEKLIQTTGWNKGNTGLLKASYLMKEKRIDEAIEALESVDFALSNHESTDHPLFEMLQRRLKLQNYPVTLLKQKLAEGLQQDELYQPLYDHPRFLQLISKWKN